MGPSFSLALLPLHRVLVAVNSVLQQGQVGLTIEDIIRPKSGVLQNVGLCLMPYLVDPRIQTQTQRRKSHSALLHDASLSLTTLIAAAAAVTSLHNVTSPRGSPLF